MIPRSPPRAREYLRASPLAGRDEIDLGLDLNLRDRFEAWRLGNVAGRRGEGEDDPTPGEGERRGVGVLVPERVGLTDDTLVSPGRSRPVIRSPLRKVQRPRLLPIGLGRQRGTDRGLLDPE